ncbi:hypothetical protein ACLEPN_30465 [Myxococcus sp. 1LA]
MTLRAYRADGVTADEYVMTDRRGRFAAEGFTRLELAGPNGHKWMVTVYTTAGDWDEPDMVSYATHFDTSGGGGHILRVMPAMLVSTDAGQSHTPLTARLRSTHNGVPRITADASGAAMPLRTDADGRLLVVTPTAAQVLPQMLDSGVATSGSAQSMHLLGTALDVSAYKSLWLRCHSANVGSGNVTPVLRSLASNGAQLAEYEGGAVTIGGAGEVMAGPGLNTELVGKSRAFGARILRAQPLLKFGGTMTSYSVHWELWAER